MRCRGLAFLAVLGVAACDMDIGSGRDALLPRRDASAADAPSSSEGGFVFAPLPEARVEPEPYIIRFALSPPGDGGTPCSWAIPDAPDGEALDTRRMRLVVVRDGGVQSLYRVDSSDGCATPGAWYFDDPSTPRAVTLCPETCSKLSGTLALEFLPGPVPPGPK